MTKGDWSVLPPHLLPSNPLARLSRGKPDSTWALAVGWGPIFFSCVFINPSSLTLSSAKNSIYSNLSILVAIEAISGPSVWQTINAAILSTQASLNAMQTVVAMLAVIVYCAAKKFAPPTLGPKVSPEDQPWEKPEKARKGKKKKEHH